MRTVEIRTPATKPEQAYVCLPLPQGPYIRVWQHTDISKILHRDFSEAMKMYPANIYQEFDIEWGYYTIGNVKGIAAIVGGHIDTSD
jgi:hypothetical protein